VTGIECDLKDRQALVAGEGPARSGLMLMISCERGGDACQAEQQQEQGSSGRTAHGLFIALLARAPHVTRVSASWRIRFQSKMHLRVKSFSPAARLFAACREQ
jgi:hypothetical protein